MPSPFEHYHNQIKFPLPETMKAVTLSGTGWEHLKCTQVPVPQVGANQLLARVDAAGVCASILKMIIQGSKHTFLNGWDLELYPCILGDEGSITIVRVGENLTGQYEPGQRFAIQPAVDLKPINFRERYTNQAEGMTKCAVGYTLPGHMAEYILIQEEVLQCQCLLPLPDEALPYFAVSMAEPISCVYSAQQRHIHIKKESPFSPRIPELGLLSGGTAVVIGAGAMGRMHMELALRFRPNHLIISDVIEEKLDHAVKILSAKAKQLGVKLISVLGDKLNETVYQVTEGAGADDIILAVGIQGVQQNALGLLGQGGVANLFGGLPRGKHILELDAIAVHYDEIKVVGSSGGQPSDLKATLEAFTNEEINPGGYVTGVGSLRHAPQALQMIQDQKLDGKVILYPHTDVDELQWVDDWNKENEEQFLEKHLQGID